MSAAFDHLGEHVLSPETAYDRVFGLGELKGRDLYEFRTASADPGHLFSVLTQWLDRAFIAGGGDTPDVYANTAPEGYRTLTVELTSAQVAALHRHDRHMEEEAATRG